MTKRGAMAMFTQWGWGGAILALSLLLRLYRLTDPSIWSDEGFSLEMVTYPLPAIWGLSGQDVHPPLYYVILKGWVELAGSNNLWWTRGLSVLCGVLDVGLGMWLMVLVSTRRAAVVAGLLLACLPIAVRYSQDARMYSMLGTFLLGATIALVYWVKCPSKKRYLMVYALSMVAGFYTHYFAIFAACSHWLYLALIRLPRLGGHRHIERLGWWLANGAMAILYSPWLPMMLKQFAKFGRGWIQPLSIETVPSAFWKFVIGNDGRANGALIFWVLPLVCVAIAIRVLSRAGGQYRFNVLIVVCGLFTIIATLCISLITPVFVERYLFFSALMMPMIVALALEKVKSSAWFTSALVLILAIEVCGLNNIYRQQHMLNNPYRIADNQLGRLMAYFDTVSISGDVLVAGDVYVFYAAKYYGTKGRALFLYTPPAESGASGRPTGADFYALMVKYPEDTYIDNLDDFNTENNRVWYLPYTHQPEGHRLKIPTTWRLIRHEPGGDNALDLYVICSPQAQDLPEACE